MTSRVLRQSLIVSFAVGLCSLLPSPPSVLCLSLLVSPSVSQPISASIQVSPVVSWSLPLSLSLSLPASVPPVLCISVPLRLPSSVSASISMSESRSVVSHSLQPPGLYSPWNSPGQTTGVGSRSLLQGTFTVQGWNPGLPQCRWILHQLSHQASPITPKKFNYTEQLYQRNSHTVKKVLGPTADFPTWGIW